MSASKATSNYGFSSYFYNYNEARSELGYAGIRNLGCICYMISMLQQLFMTESFRYLVLMADDGQPECQVRKAAKEIDDNLFHQLQVMFANLELT
jgi:ubiquitin carboxyl-terminal hydrolase 9/24